MNFTILGQGTGLPEYSMAQDIVVEYAKKVSCHTDEQRRLLPALYRMTGVKRRHSVLLEAPEDQESRQSFFPYPDNGNDLGPGIGQRMEKYEKCALVLAEQAAREALSQSELAPDDITHLVTVSCSGFYAPGVDVGLIQELGLRRTVQRTHVGFMGCHGALNGLRVARGFTHGDPNARVLLCAVELCSLHYHYGWEPEQIVANALFADGAAAIVGSGEPVADRWRVVGTGSCLMPDSQDAMTWRIRDHGFVMSLSPHVPDLICTHLRGWMEEWLAGYGMTLPEIRSWAIHPGGPRIIQSAAKALDLDKDVTEDSREILKTHGNMSSPTILFILKKMRERNAPLPLVAMAFGPGLMVEAVLIV
ncbi:MAG: type III polyketide synthase [Candidatus Hydrogenedentes bacterium]|nr:type III polyketide synthase [Candidatus Hydrogenedentota bacterium]